MFVELVWSLDISFGLEFSVRGGEDMKLRVEFELARFDSSREGPLNIDIRSLKIDKNSSSQG